MKTITRFIILHFAFCIFNCSAQYSANTTISNLGGSNSVVTAGATSNYTASVAIGRTRYVTCRVQFVTTSASASGNLTNVVNWQQ